MADEIILKNGNTIEVMSVWDDGHGIVKCEMADGEVSIPTGDIKQIVKESDNVPKQKSIHSTSNNITWPHDVQKSTPIPNFNPNTRNPVSGTDGNWEMESRQRELEGKMEEMERKERERNERIQRANDCRESCRSAYWQHIGDPDCLNRCDEIERGGW